LTTSYMVLVLWLSYGLKKGRVQALKTVAEIDAVSQPAWPKTVWWNPWPEYSSLSFTCSYRSQL